MLRHFFFKYAFFNVLLINGLVFSLLFCLFLWEAHKYHHAATEFTILTGNRLHHLDSATRSLFTCVPLAILGAPIEAYVTARVIKQTIDLFQHSDVEWRYGWIGKWLVFSPVGHRIHHSKLEEHWDTNFGNIMPIWDRIFGTRYSGDNVNAEVDVINNPYNKHGVWREYMLCFKLVFAALFDSIQTGRWRRRAYTEPKQAYACIFRTAEELTSSGHAVSEGAETVRM